MGDNTVTLSDGRVLKIDLYKMTVREYRALFNNNTSPDDDDNVYARVLGLTLDEWLDLPQPDYRLAIQQIIMLARSPLADPNSQSASTSD